MEDITSYQFFLVYSKKVAFSTFNLAVCSIKYFYATDEEWKVVNAITSCRTWKLGSHDYKCDTCGHVLTVYNSCRNRHCPQCLGLAKAEWILNRDRELLPVHYFHLVFTLPHIFNPLVLQNKRHMYTLLFKAASQTLKQVVAHPDKPLCYA